MIDHGVFPSEPIKIQTVYTNVITSEPKSAMPTPTKANVNSTEHGHGDNATSPAARAMLALSSVFRRASHSTATQTPISNQITDNHQIAAMQTKITQLQNSNIEFLHHSQSLEDSLKSLYYENQQLLSEWTAMEHIVKHLPKCSCKCRRAASETATSITARTAGVAAVAVTNSAAAGSASLRLVTPGYAWKLHLLLAPAAC